MVGPTENGDSAGAVRVADQLVVGDGLTAPHDNLHPAEINPTFALLQNGEWGLIGGENGMFAVKYVRACMRSGTGNLKATGALIVLADHDTPVIFRGKETAQHLGRRRRAIHDGEKGSFDTSIAPIYRRTGVVKVGDYVLFYSKALTPKGKGIFLKIDAPKTLRKVTIPGSTPTEQILSGLARENQVSNS
jgi:hypothetical protein